MVEEQGKSVVQSILKNSWKYLLGLLFLAAVALAPAYFHGRTEYKEGYQEGFKAGQESVKCSGGYHISNPFEGGE